MLKSFGVCIILYVYLCVCVWCVCVFVSSSLVRGPGVFGEVQVYWNITPAVVSEFKEISGTVTLRDRQSAATIILTVLFNMDCSVH